MREQKRMRLWMVLLADAEIGLEYPRQRMNRLLLKDVKNFQDNSVSAEIPQLNVRPRLALLGR